MGIRIIKVAISIIYYCIYKVYAFLFCLLNGQYPGKLTILTYHSIMESNSSKFEKQMCELLNTGEPISIDDMDRFDNGKNYIAVTFDDGYQNILKYAIPVMQKKNIPAMIFITTGFLGKRPGWISSDKNRNKYELLLSEDQIKEQFLSSIRFGSHTFSHPHLDKLEIEKLRFEIYESKRSLENILNTNIHNISLPFGSYNDEVLNAIKEAGYKRIFLNIPVMRNNSSSTMLYGRTDVSADDWEFEYKLKISGGYEWLPVGIYMKEILNNLISTIKISYIR